MSVWQALVAGRYRLLGPLGTGGMGRVWLSRDEILGRDVAVKEVSLPEGLTGTEREELHSRTLREARAAARLSHPNVVQIYDVVWTDGRPWIVMEYVRSRSLHDVITKEGPLPATRVAEIGVAVLAALNAAHRAGVLHRDIKPSNVLLAEDGRIVLTDFGLATFDGGEGVLTRPGLVLGSPQYVAPERARDGVSTVESDLWSLGATLYAAVEGRSPYARSTAMATLTALATVAPDPARQAGALRPVLNGLLRKNPRSRIRISEADRLLRRAAAGVKGPRPRPRPRPEPAERTRVVVEGPTAVVPRPRPDRARDRVHRIVVSVLLLAIAAAGATLLGSSQSSLASHRETGGRAAPASVPSAPTSPSAAVDPADPVACGPSGVRIDLPPSPVSRPRPFGLPFGWTWYDDPAGFMAAVPVGWQATAVDGVVCFREPGGGRLLSIGRTGPLSRDLLAECVRQEAALTVTGRLSDYRRVSLAKLDYFSAAADWEYSYRLDGDRLHVGEREFIAPSGQSYEIFWRTHEFDWLVNQQYYLIVTASFRP
jgi:serine/threonine protein kinase